VPPANATTRGLVQCGKSLILLMHSRLLEGLLAMA